MEPVLFALALSVIAAVGVMVAVALPHLRGGAPVLSKSGWRVAWRVLSVVQSVTRRPLEGLARGVARSSGAPGDADEEERRRYEAWARQQAYSSTDPVSGYPTGYRAPGGTNGYPVAPSGSNGYPVAPSGANGYPVAPPDANGSPVPPVGGGAAERPPAVVDVRDPRARSRSVRPDARPDAGPHPDARPHPDAGPEDIWPQHRG